MSASLACGRFRLDLGRPLIMGVVNVTPDSFSDGGRFDRPQAAIDHARRLIEAGADQLENGDESTRPGAAPVEAPTELARVLPVIEGLRDAGVPISVDTSKPGVMVKAVAAGADMVNDVNAFRAAGAFEALAATGVAVCLMHMQGEPRTMQANPHYDDVVREVGEFLRARLDAALTAGIAHERIVIDPGFGFGKTLDHNLELLRRLEAFASWGVPVLAGLSRKAMLGAITGRAVGDRLAAGVAATLLAVSHGARIVRVHDVAPTRDALAVLAAVERQGKA